MKHIDHKIKQALQSKIQPIDDNSFTKRIIDTYLAKKAIVKYCPFGNFLPIVIGVSFLLISIGFAFALEQDYQWINEIKINKEEGLLLVIIFSVFLLYKLTDDFFIGDLAHKSSTKQKS